MTNHATRGLRPLLRVLVVTGALCIGLVMASLASAAPPAGYSSVNEAVDGTGHCKNGQPNVNCNIYDGKQYVWMNGGPAAANLGDGNYFFAVLEPGGQASPNDGTAEESLRRLRRVHEPDLFRQRGHRHLCRDARLQQQQDPADAVREHAESGRRLHHGDLLARPRLSDRSQHL